MIRKLFVLGLVVIIISACSFLSVQPTPTPLPAAPTETPPCQIVADCPGLPSPLPPPATMTATITGTPTSTDTPVPTSTPVPTNTPVPSDTAIPKPYQVQPNTPLYLQNFAHPNLACDWLGVAGQVFDKAGKPVSGIVVVVDGAFADKAFEQIGLTGKAPAYGDGGFELVLSNQDTASTSPFTITLFDVGGKALSDPFSFSSVADCKKNLILVNFVAN
jgi:hypothetical protein